MAHDLVQTDNLGDASYDHISAGRLIRIAIPTNCNDNSIPGISSLLKLMGCSTWVTFIHVVPFEADEFSDCIGSEDLRYAMSVAEMKLYSFIKKFQKTQDITFDYKIVKGRPVDAILDVVKKGEFDVIGLEMGDIGHLDPQFSNGVELISRSKVPVIVFGKKKERSEVNMGRTTGEE
ncbi:MAG: universal stress protein [Thermoplasmata archaeon]